MNFRHCQIQLFPLVDHGLILRSELLCQTYGLRSGIVVPDEESEDVTHYAMAQRLLTYIYEQQPAVVGVGWGTVIGLAAKRLEGTQVPSLVLFSS